MLTKKTIGFIGGGNIAEALIKGLIASKTVTASQIHVSDKLPERQIYIAEKYGVEVLNNHEATARADVVFIMVKPNDVAGVLKEIAPVLTKEKLLISAAAGVTTDKIIDTLTRTGLARAVSVVRAMPNTPAIVREGATAICAGEGAGKEALRLAEALFKAVGRVVVLRDESLMDAVTGLSGSGPAYIFLIMEGLSEGGVKAGLPKDIAEALAVQTALGAARLAMESKDKSLEELRRMVTSPGGTTIEGLKKLEEGNIKEVLISAVEAAAKRARELSGGS